MTVHDRNFAGIFFQPAQTGVGDVALKKWAALIAEFADLKHALAHRGGIRAVRVHRLAECDCDGEAEKLRPFPKEAAAAIREDAVPNLIEPHGDDGALCLPRDDFVAALNAEQRAAFREFSLGENADDLAGLDVLDGGADGVLGARVRDRDRADKGEERTEDAVVVVRLPDDEADGARARELEEDGVNPREVVRQHEEAAFGQPVEPLRGDLVRDLRDRGEDFADEPFGEAGRFLLLHAG